MGFHALKSNEITQMELDHQQKVRAFAGECCVVLENDGILPVKNPCKVALYGNGARQTVKGGTGSGDVNSRSVVNIEQGLVEAGFTVPTTAWLDKFDAGAKKHQEDYKEFIKEKMKETGMNEIGTMFMYPLQLAPITPIDESDIFEDCELAIYVIARDSGEGGDRNYKRGDYLLSEEEIAAITKVASTYKKTIVLLNVGGILDVTELKSIPGINAIMNVSQLGNIGGNVVADVLMGIVEPSGRLTDTWARSYEDYPNWQNFSHNNNDVLDEIYYEGIYVGYRYFDTFDVEPLYPFGYGLGYSKHEITTDSVTIEGTAVTVTATVKNIGDIAGKEVVQVYVSAPLGAIDKPYQELVAFAKTPVIEAGATATVTMTFDLKQVSSYDVYTSARLLEDGDYIVRVGKNSRSTKAVAVITLDETAATEQLKKLFEDEVTFEEYKAPGRKPSFCNDDAELAGAIKLTLSSDDVECKEISYQEERPVIENKREDFITFDDVLAGSASVEELVAQLNEEQLAHLCTGGFSNGMDTMVIGCSSANVPGAAAETTTFCEEDRKIPFTILADGPAGLRLQPHFKADGYDGKLLPGGQVFGLTTFPFPDDLPETAVDYYQYCTAIPIASALAQSWNMDLIYEAGNIVGVEMKEYYVHYWLAPGMNIHRNPLCGRNFEYYSEDPLLTGRCAAADTKGVQAHGGQGTTIKHFALNNQEDNRMFSNSHASERALRDLYLRGFELAIKEAQPYSIMTSYNLVNGVHAANNVDLIQYAARDEWGFEGVVMTDWCTTMEPSRCKNPRSYSDLCVKAGNDLIMPGCANDVKEILEGVKKGSIGLGDLQFCATNILRITAKCFK